MNNREGGWFLTYTGKKFYPIDPRPEDICIEDIAHALSMICRFGGHCIEFYSVAEHSVIVSDACQVNPLQGLMHDATEAYCGDMVRPLKRSVPQYRDVEYMIWLAICERFHIPNILHDEIKAMDNRALMTERRDLLTPPNHPWSLEKDFPPFENRIVAINPMRSEKLFLDRFDALMNKPAR